MTVIAAGERWGRDEGSLRPAIEDLIGAGAVLAALETGSASPEARLATAAFAAAAPHLREYLLECASGRELRELGFAQDAVLFRPPVVPFRLPSPRGRGAGGEGFLRPV